MADPPRHVADAARRAPTMRVPGSTVADIAYDSILDDDESHASERRITFTADEVEVALVVRPDGTRLELLVEVRPESPVVVRTFDDGERQQVDSTGAAKLVVKPGMTSLVVEPTDPAAHVVQTAWVSL